MRLMDEELSGRAPEAIARLGVGYVPQGRRLFPGLTVADNLGLGRLRRRGRASGGTHWDDDPIFTYFPRVRERLGVGWAITEEVFEAVDQLRRDIAVVIVDHDLDLVLALADRAVVLDRGHVVHRGPARPLSEDLELRRRVLWV